MDKFRELQVQIERVIAKIDKQIKEREEQIRVISDKKWDVTQAKVI